MNGDCNTTCEKGSILMWILIAVALFGALSAVVAQMTRGGGNSDREVKQIDAAEMLQFSNAVKNAVQSMKVDGVRLAEVSFDNSFVSGYANAACTTDKCRVFGTGGGLSWQAPEAKWLDADFSSEGDYAQWWFAGDACVQDYPGNDGGDCSSDTAPNEDLVLMLEYVGKSACLAVNKELGIADVAEDAPPTSGCHTAAKYTGALNEANRISHANLDGKPAGCFKQTAACGSGTSGDYYVFYRVLAGQ